jgi:hypothetical protein
MGVDSGQSDFKVLVLETRATQPFPRSPAQLQFPLPQSDLSTGKVCGPLVEIGNFASDSCKASCVEKTSFLVLSDGTCVVPPLAQGRMSTTHPSQKKKMVYNHFLKYSCPLVVTEL